jgi:hypothetical protein
MTRVWSSIFSAPATPFSSQRTHITFSPDLSLQAGAYAIYAIPTLGHSDASEALVYILDTYNNEPYFTSAWRSSSIRPFQIGIRFDGPIQIEAGVRGASFDLTVSPVPEPKTWGLILAGLGFVIGVTRSRKCQ